MIASSAAGNGNIKVLRGIRNLDDFYNELETFPGGIHDDMVDCLSGAIAYLGTSSSTTGTPEIVQESADQVSNWLDDDGTEYGGSAAGYFSRFGR